jgi:hypothetical protein
LEAVLVAGQIEFGNKAGIQLRTTRVKSQADAATAQRRQDDDDFVAAVEE